METWIGSHLGEIVGAAFLAGQMWWGFKGMHERQDITNGRLDKHAAKLDEHGQRLATVEERTR